MTPTKQTRSPLTEINNPRPTNRHNRHGFPAVRLTDGILRQDPLKPDLSGTSEKHLGWRRHISVPAHFVCV